MGSFTEVIVYALWAVGPLVAYQALVCGLARDRVQFATVFGLYAAVVALIWLALPPELPDGSGTVSRLSVIVPWLGTVILSLLLYFLGSRAGNR